MNLFYPIYLSLILNLNQYMAHIIRQLKFHPLKISQQAKSNQKNRVLFFQGFSDAKKIKFKVYLLIFNKFQWNEFDLK